MQRRHFPLFVLALAAPWKSIAGSSEHDEIDAVLKAFVEAWNRHDAKAFSMVFTADAQFTNVAGASAIGRKAIEDFHAPRFAARFKDSHQVIRRFTVKMIKSDVAAVDAWWEMTGARTESGEETGRREGLLSFVMVKDGEQWQIAVMHNMNLNPSSRSQP